MLTLIIIGPIVEMFPSRVRKSSADGQRRAVVGRRRAAVLGQGLWWLSFAGGLALLAGCESPRISQEPAVLEVRDMPEAVAEAYGRLTGLADSADERSRAAGQLLAMSEPAAAWAVASALGPEQSSATTSAVLLAINRADAPLPEGLWRPILRRLPDLPEAQVPAAVRALGRFDAGELYVRLRDTALDSAKQEKRRVRAIAALSQWRTRDAAGALMDLTSVTESGAVRTAAFASLAELTGIDRYGEDRGAWERWWADHRRLNTLEWNRQLIRQFAYQRSSRQTNEEQLERKLREAERALYQASSPEDQAGVLAYMLENPLEATRLLAVDLAQARLVQGEAFEEPLRRALRARLGDASAQVRRQTADVLRDLNDTEAAEIVATRLIEGQEQVSAVQAANLQLLAAIPRKRATAAILDLMQEPALKPEAAAALAAIAEAGQLTPRRSDEALSLLRDDLSDGQRPTPSMIRLLGRIGRNPEWERIEQWIDDPDPVIKQAAAQAWADATDRSLAVLAGRAGDPIVQPIVIRAATDRGQDPQTLRKLIANPPRQTQFVEAWERALVAMVGRPSITPILVLEVIQQVQDRARSGALTERMLTAALDREPAPEAGRTSSQAVSLPWLQVRLARAENRRALNEFELAILDYEALLQRDTGQMPGHERERLYRGLIPTYLQVGRNEPALAAAATLLRDPGRPGGLDPAAADDPILDTLVQAVHRQLELGRVESARTVFRGLLQLLGPSDQRRLPPSLASQINQLRELLEVASPARP